MFIKDRTVNDVDFKAPTFVDSGVDANTLAKEAYVATSGNELVDMAFDKLIDYSTKLDKIKADNELARASQNAEKLIMEYENSWQGMNKYSDDNYERYVSGLKETYGRAKMDFLSTTKYATEQQVNQFDVGLSNAQTSYLYQQNAKKSSFEIESTIDETEVNASRLMDLYKQTGDESYLQNANQLYSNLSPLVGKAKVEMLKRQATQESISGRIQYQINEVFNTSGTLGEKRAKLNQIRENLYGKNGTATLEGMANELVKKGLYSDVDTAKADLLESYNSKINYHLTNAIDRVDNEEMRLQSKKEMELRRETENFMKAHSANDAVETIAIVTGEPQNAETIVSMAYDNPHDNILFGTTTMTPKDFVNWRTSSTRLNVLSQQAISGIDGRLRINKDEDPRVIGEKKAEELYNLNGMKQTPKVGEQLHAYALSQVVDGTKVSNNDVRIFDSINDNPNIGEGDKKNLTKETLGYYNKGIEENPVEFNINTLGSRSKTFGKVKEIFGTKNADGTYTPPSQDKVNTVMNIVQGAINSGKYKDIPPGTQITTANFYDLIQLNGDLGRDMRKYNYIITDKKMQSRTAVGLTVNTNDAVQYIDNRLSKKYNLK